MRDIATLKERVGVAERHLKATETARNRESESLMEMWRKIRERFNHQEGEIARYRAEVETLTEGNQSLSRMVDDLIAIIDGNVDRGRDETVPKITNLAEDLLASEPAPEDFANFAADEPVAPAPEFDDTDDVIDLVSEVDEPIDFDVTTSPVEVDTADVQDDRDTNGSADDAVSEHSLSPGIQSLIQRVEGAVGEASGASPDDGYGERESDDTSDEDDNDDLARELEEIEMLRNELSGLRDRISAGDA